MRVQRERPLPRAPEPGACAICGGPDFAAGGSDVAERGEVVVGRRLGMILRPAERLQPLGSEQVPVGASGARDLPVRHVADEGGGGRRTPARRPGSTR